MILLFVIYIAFIGLGIPDSLFGVAWPAIYDDLALPFSYGSIITTTVYICSSISCLNSARLINKYGTAKIAAISTSLTAIGLFCYSKSSDFIFIAVSAIPLGLGAGSIDTALNSYVAANYSARVMSFLHCFYGIGVTVSPVIITRTLSQSSEWRNSYMTAFCIQALISLILIAAIPLWKKERTKQEEKTKVLSLKEIASIPGTKILWMIFLCSCGIECTLSAWGSTFLVEVKNMLPEIAASKMVFYYIGMTLGRFLSGLFAGKSDPDHTIRTGIAVLALGTILAAFSRHEILLTLGLGLIGAGNGPLFPNLNYMTPLLFGDENSVAIIGTQMTVSYITLTLVPIFVGQLAKLFSMGIFPYVLLCFMLCFAMGYTYCVKKLIKAD